MKIRISRRLLTGVVASMAAVGTVVGTSGTPALAASTGWRITQVFGAKQQYPDIQALAANSANDAWITGEGGIGLSLLVERWNGSTWQPLAGPRVSAAM
jgi:hypothetical protein